jgi:hypothetical protein
MLKCVTQKNRLNCAFSDWENILIKEYPAYSFCARFDWLERYNESRSIRNRFMSWVMAFYVAESMESL